VKISPANDQKIELNRKERSLRQLPSQAV